MSKDKTYTVKGEINFFLKHGKIRYASWDYPKEDKEFTNMFLAEIAIYDLMDGLDFARCVKDGDFIDNDGTLADIFVGEYISNLGISEKGIHQGEFMLALHDFKKLCKKYDIKVNWANK